ncbi:complex 2-like [Octopus vulgaris]|uniref:Elongator complex protein 2 n=1 Tax=Octopus vulgaris TaxID=6645 RepID=A0AA36ATH4_OCTVU|nr:complex 2-like [Octopus vulgaris]
MVDVITKYISAGCNSTPHVADWGKNGCICFGSCNSVAVYQPQVPQSQIKDAGSILSTLKSHKNRVNCVKWMKTRKAAEWEIISGSVDKTAILWTQVGNQFQCSQILAGHDGAITTLDNIEIEDLDFEPKSEVTESPSIHNLIVTSSVDSTIKIWHRFNSEEFHDIQTIPLNTGFALDVALVSPENSSGVILACGCDNQKVNLYVLQQGQFVSAVSLSGHDDWVSGVDFCVEDNGDLLLASCGQDFIVRIWRISQKTTPEENSNIIIRDKPATGSIQMKETLIDVQSKGSSLCFAITLESVLLGHDGWIYSVRWHPPIEKENGWHQPLRLLTASMDKTMILWSVDKDSGVWVEEVRVGEVGGNTLGFYGGLFSPCGDSILAHGYQGALHQWTFNKEKLCWEPAVTGGGHFKAVDDIAWDPVDGSYLLSVGLDQTCRFHAPWVTDTLQRPTWYEVARPQVHGYDIQCLAVLHRYKFVSGADEKVLRVFNAPKNFIENFCNISKLDIEVELKNKEISSVPQGASVPALGLSNKAVYCNEKTAEEEIEAHPNEQYPEVYFSPVTLHEPPTEEHLLQNTLWPETQKLYGHGYEIFAVTADPRGEILASACKASKSEFAGIILWNCSNWKQLGVLEGPSLTVTQLAFSYDGQHLLSVSRDRTWTLFRHAVDHDIPFKKIASVDKKTSAHSRIIWSCCWSHDNAYFATASRDKKVILWNCPPPSTNDVISVQPKDNFIFSDSVTAVDMAPTFTPDNKYLLSIGLDSGIIELLSWSPDQPTPWQHLKVLDLISHHLTVKRLKFSRVIKDHQQQQNKDDDNPQFMLASCGNDFSVRIFNIFLGQC